MLNETGSFCDVKLFVEISGLLAPFCHFKTDDAKWLAMCFEAKASSR